METGLFDIQADHLGGLKQPRQVRPGSREVIYGLFGRADSGSSDPDPASHGSAYETEDAPDSVRKSVKTANNSAPELARCFLRLANLPNYALDRLSRRSNPGPNQSRDDSPIDLNPNALYGEKVQTEAFAFLTAK
jgi:hypothetical protein